MIKPLIFLFSFIIFLASCAGNKQTTGGSKKKRVQMEAFVLSDSVNVAWNKMIESDDKKIRDIKRLLEEISFTSEHDETQLLRLQKMQSELSGKRYTRQSMASSKIDAYDLATDSLVRETLALVNATPEMQSHAITNPLIADIQQEDNNVIIYRVRYDSWVKRYNEYIEKHSTTLAKSGTPYKDYKKMQVFELGTASN